MVIFQTFFQLTFCLSRTKKKNGFSVTKNRSNLIVVDVELVGKSYILSAIRS